MANPATHTPSRGDILKGAVIGGAINAVINGAIQVFLLRGSGPMPLTVQSIGTETRTVLGTAVLILGVVAGLVAAIVNHMTISEIVENPA